MIDLRSREEAFKQLYKEFYDYFVGELRKGKTEADKVRLHIVAEVFDDLELYKKITPIFSSTVTTLAEKRAVARAALWDALVAAHFGTYTEGLTNFLSNRVADLEDFVAGLKKLPALATHQFASAVEQRVKALEEKILNEVRPAKEEAGQAKGVQAAGDAVGPTGTQEAGS